MSEHELAVKGKMSGIGLQMQPAAPRVGVGLTPTAQVTPLTTIPARAAQPSPLFAEDLAQIAKDFPALAPHLNNSVVQWGDGPPEYQSEFYHPWEEQNPNGGRATIELYNKKLTPDAVKSLVPAEMLHLLGAIDPRSGQPVDPQWQRMKQQFLSTRTPSQIRADVEEYQQSKDPRPFSQWLQDVRGDAYMRAAAFPEINPEWKDFLTPQQRDMATKLHGYLRGFQ